MTAATLTLIDFLLARIAEDEAMAREAGGGSWYSYYRGVHLLQGVEPNDPDFDPESDVFDAATKGHARHIARHDPARVLRECEAKRQIVDEHGPLVWVMSAGPTDTGKCRTCAENEDADYDGPPLVTRPCPTVRALAAVYADHPDYREEW